MPRLPQQQMTDCVEHAPPALDGVELLPSRFLDRRIEQRQQGRQNRLQRWVEGGQPCGDFIADQLKAVLLADLEIALQQIDHRQVAHGLAVRHRPTLQHQPVLRCRRSA